MDGRSVGTVDVPASGDTVTLPVGVLQPGAHGIMLRARAGTFGLSRVSVTAATVSPPAAPENLTATAVSTSRINLVWSDRSTDETGFTIDRATNSAFTAGLTSSNVARERDVVCRHRSRRRHHILLSRPGVQRGRCIGQLEYRIGDNAT